MIILSLCDGMSCGHIALDRAGIKVDKYFAAEIKNVAIKVTKANYPDTIHIGDVNKVSYKDGVLYTENGDYNVGHIDMVIFGSPCQTFSVAMKKELRIGLEDKEKSGLFLECHRILREVNPTYFLMENVASMRDEDKEVITALMGVPPVRINSKTVAPAMRDRYYWTNIPNVQPIQEKNICLQDILTEGYTNLEKGHCLVVVDSRPATTPVKMFHRYHYKGFGNLIFKSKEQHEACVKFYDEHYRGMPAKMIPTNETNIFDGVRFLNQLELERCQTVPEGYTKCLTRNEAADVLGDGWTIDVIAHIFSFIPKADLNAELVDDLNRQNSEAVSKVMDFIAEEPVAETEEAAEDEPTDLSDAPEEIKTEIIENDKKLQEQEYEEETTEEPIMDTINRNPETIEETIFDAVEQLTRLAKERKALADLKPNDKRFSDDVRAIEYAVSVLKAVGL